MKRKYGWIPQLPDHRDYQYKWTLYKVFKLPQQVDLRSSCSPIENQGSLGSCTAHAIVGALEFLENKNQTNFYDISRLFIYYNERFLEGTVNDDSGAQLRDGIKTLVRYGYCSENIWPYNTSNFTNRPTRNAYAEAMKHKITSYHSVANLKEMLNALANGYPVIFGFTVYDGMETLAVAKTGILNMPTQDESVIGGHAVLAVGYDQSTQRILVRNSWGTAWGMTGYFTMPYEYIDKLANDMWVVIKK